MWMSAFNVNMCHSHRTYKHVSTFERACMCDERGEKEFWIYSPLLINHLSAAAKSECIFRLVLNPNANILPHTQSVIFVISETGGFYNGFSWQQGGHKTKSNKATSVQYANIIKLNSTFSFKFLQIFPLYIVPWVGGFQENYSSLFLKTWRPLLGNIIATVHSSLFAKIFNPLKDRLYEMQLDEGYFVVSKPGHL